MLIPVAKPASPDSYAKLPRQNFIDEHVWNKLAKLGIAPSDPCSDATFLRRAFLDAIGRVPTPEETRDFLADASPDRRTKLVDHAAPAVRMGRFLGEPWADLLRPNPYRVGIKAVFSMDSLARRIPTQYPLRPVRPRNVDGSRQQLPQGRRSSIAIDANPKIAVATNCSWVFAWTALMPPSSVRGLEPGRLLPISPPISRSLAARASGYRHRYQVARKSCSLKAGSLKHPRLGKEMQPRPLFGETPRSVRTTICASLVRWILSENQKYFAKVQVNRVWADMMGRGIVEPIDDLRATNPPTNGPLLDALAEQFHKDGYDLKKLVRRIMMSHVYGLSSIPNGTNVGDLRNFSRHYRQRLRAETMLDAISDIVGVRDNFDAGAPGTRAMEQWTVRTSSIFLDSFGRPNPNQDPPCERLPDTTVVQAAPPDEIRRRLRAETGDSGSPAKLAATRKRLPKSWMNCIFGCTPACPTPKNAAKPSAVSTPQPPAGYGRFALGVAEFAGVRVQGLMSSRSLAPLGRGGWGVRGPSRDWFIAAKPRVSAAPQG
ncbi:MAG: DUF1553 domain-containing protein [Gemmataceae bacterium]